MEAQHTDNKWIEIVKVQANQTKQYKQYLFRLVSIFPVWVGFWRRLKLSRLICISKYLFRCKDVLACWLFKGVHNQQRTDFFCYFTIIWINLRLFQFHFDWMPKSSVSYSKRVLWDRLHAQTFKGIEWERERAIKSLIFWLCICLRYLLSGLISANTQTHNKVQNVSSMFKHSQTPNIFHCSHILRPWLDLRFDDVEQIFHHKAIKKVKLFCFSIIIHATFIAKNRFNLLLRRW